MKRERWNSRAIMWPCKDCGCEVSPVRDGKRSTWTVSDRTWKEAGMKAQGKRPLGSGEFLCLHCLESRLGRKLTLADHMGGGYSTFTSVSRRQWRGWLRARKKAAGERIKG
jgi:hypothetical protein